MVGEIAWHHKYFSPSWTAFQAHLYFGERDRLDVRY